MRRIAERGVKFANFHTTALCSPTRASLLTGRNATTNGMATIAEFASGFPGISTRIPFENGFISEVLAEHGYNTYCVGKWHLTPGEECNLAAYKGRWPLGRGFERFYGWLGGETNNWYPDLVHDNHQIDPPGRPEDGYHVADDLAGKAIEFIRDAKVIDPDKPFFMYLAPQAGHAPHQVPLEWADKYKGKFDQGYEAIRAGILARQIELGLLPEGTELSPINPHGEPERTSPDGKPWPLLDTVRPWDSLSADEQRLFARMAEVFAGYISYWDDRIGRVLDYLEESGQLDNTIIVVISDNGASGEGGPNGEFNEWRFFNGLAERSCRSRSSASTSSARRSPTTTTTPAGRGRSTRRSRTGSAGPAPRAASPTCASCPGPRRSRRDPTPRQQYVHAVDVVPTIYDLLGIEPPEVIKGYLQSPIEGESFAAALTDATAPGKETQFYTMLGQRSIYHDGWLACTVHPPLSGWGSFEKDEWELFHLETDRAQTKNVAADDPERLGVDEGACGSTTRASTTGCRSTTAPRSSRCSPSGRAADPIANATSTSPTVPTSPSRRASRSTAARTRSSAGVELDSADAEGVLYAHGGVAGGHSLYVKDKRLKYVFNWVGTHLQTIEADREITAGRHVFAVDFAVHGPNTDPSMPGFAGTATLYIDDEPVGSGDIVTQPGNFCLIGDGICVGRDSASPVTPDYADRGTFAFTGGTIDKVVVDVTGEHYVDHEAQVRAWLMKD